MAAKDFRNIVKEAERQGFRVEQLRSGHWRFVPPNPSKPMVHAAGTPSDRRAIDNLLGQLRRSGFVWPPPRKD
jgi:hypothetical protein